MKTFSKVLSMLIVVVMCVSVMGASAYAVDIVPAGSDVTIGGVDIDVAPQGDSFVDSGSGIEIEPVIVAAPSQAQPEVAVEVAPFSGSDSDTFNAAAGSVAVVGTTACKDAAEINAALANGSGSTIKLIQGATVSGELIINRAATLDLNGGTVSGKITVNAPLTITDSTGGSGQVTGSIDKLASGSVSVTGGKFATSIGVAAYVSGDYKVVDDGSMHKVTKNEADPLASTVATIGGNQYDSLDKVNAVLASQSATVKLAKNASGNLEFLKGGTLDLNGFTLTGNVVVYGGVNIIDSSGSNAGGVTGNIVVNSGAATLNAGTYNPKPDTSDGKVKLGTGFAFSGNKVVPANSAYVATVNGVGYTTLQDAYDAASAGDTINVLEKTDSAADYSLSGPITKNVNFQLGSNGLGAVTVNNASVSFNGGKVASITASNGSVTLNGTEVSGAVTLDKSTLNMASGSIGSLASNNGSKLYVSGGKVGGFSGSGDVTRAITGGVWTVPDSAMNYFEGSIANGYAKSGTTSPYTIVGSGSGGGGSSPTIYGSYAIYNSPYVKNSSPAVYVTMPAPSSIGYYWGTSSTAANNGALPGSAYTVSGNTLTFNTAWLNTLDNGTYYLFYGYYDAGGNPKGDPMGSFTVTSGGGGGGSIIPGGTWTLEYVNGSKWYGGDDTLEFYSPLFVSGAAELPRVRIDTKSAPNKTISLEQYWENGTGYFKLGRNLMNSLSANEVYYIQVYDAANPDQMSNILTFTLGPTLKPIDTDKHVINSTKNLKFLCSDQIARVYVGNIELTSDDDFALSNNRKTVTLSAEFLNKRTAGNTYTIKVLTYSGDYASCTFQILTTGQASSSPRTGDESNLGLWAAFLLLSGTAVVVLLPKLRKHGEI